MDTPVAASPTIASPQQPGRLGPWFAALWLAFLGHPLLEASRLLPGARGWVALGVVVAFGAAHLSMWTWLRSRRTGLALDVPQRAALVWSAVLVVLAVVVVVSLGEEGLTAMVYVGAATVMLHPPRVAAGIVGSLLLITLVSEAVVPGWDLGPSLPFSILATAAAVFGVRSMVVRNVQLVQNQQTLAELAAERERTRLARDLHDILGHSLTVITIKAELAGRMFDEAPERARAEIADLERLSRDALGDVRRAVEGYRDLSLPGELARARVALEAASIEARLPGSTDDVPSDLRELFAWVVREGVTNVIRHSGARRCEVLLGADRAEVRDDGRRPASLAGPGSGLLGLQERASSLGARVVTRRLEPGWSLAVVRE